MRPGLGGFRRQAPVFGRGLAASHRLGGFFVEQCGSGSRAAHAAEGPHIDGAHVLAHAQLYAVTDSNLAPRFGVGAVDHDTALVNRFGTQ